MKKIIILDLITEKVYVSDYDTNVFGDFGEFLAEFNDHHGTNIQFNYCHWMEADYIKINIV